MGTAEEVEQRIVEQLMEKEANARELETISKCANKTFLKARQNLERRGFLTKRYEPKENGGLHAIYSLTPKGRTYARKETLKKRANLSIDGMGVETNEKYARALDCIKQLNEDVSYYEERIAELEDWPPIDKHLIQVGPRPISKEEAEELMRLQEEWEKRQNDEGRIYSQYLKSLFGKLQNRKLSKPEI